MFHSVPGKRAAAAATASISCRPEEASPFLAASCWQLFQVASVLAEEEWQPTEAVQKWAGKRASIIIVRKVSGDAFCIARRQEQRQGNTSLSERTVWRELIERGLAGGVHKRVEPPWRLSPVPRGEVVQASPILRRPRHVDACEALKALSASEAMPVGFPATHKSAMSPSLTSTSRCWLTQHDAGPTLPAVAAWFSCCGAVRWPWSEFRTANGC